MKQHNSLSLVLQRRESLLSPRGFRRILSLIGFETEVENRLTGAKIVGGLGESVGKGRGRGSPCRAKERGCGTSPCTDERLHPSLWSQVHDTSSCVARCLDDASTRVFRAACASYALHGVREKRVWNFLDGIRSKRIPVERRNSSAKSLWVNDSYTWITMIFFFSREQVAILRIRDEYIRCTAFLLILEITRNVVYF